MRVIDARELKAKVDLVSFAKQFTKLRRVGSQVRGLCLFHAERHPSFYIHAQNRLFIALGAVPGATSSRSLGVRPVATFVKRYES